MLGYRSIDERINFGSMARKVIWIYLRSIILPYLSLHIQSMITLNKQYPLHLTLITTSVNII